jgi:hypothetical protein
MTKVIDCEQGSPEWLAARAGRVTSAGVADALAFPKRKTTEEMACRWNYKKRLALERITGKSFDAAYVTRAMREGRDAEPFARAAYEVAEQVLVDTVGFVCHPTIEFAGSSPDGWVGDDGLVEFKAPEVTTHFEYLLMGDQIPEEYQLQCIWQLACHPEREWIDFVSYDKSQSLPQDMRLHIVRLVADRDVIGDVEAKVRQFLSEVNGLVMQRGATEKVGA